MDLREYEASKHKAWAEAVRDIVLYICFAIVVAAFPISAAVRTMYTVECEDHE